MDENADLLSQPWELIRNTENINEAMAAARAAAQEVVTQGQLDRGNEDAVIFVASDYYDFIIGPLMDRGLIGIDDFERWEALRDNPDDDLADDPRVVTFVSETVEFQRILRAEKLLDRE